jgi:hypothetical protein
MKKPPQFALRRFFFAPVMAYSATSVPTLMAA